MPEARELGLGQDFVSPQSTAPLALRVIAAGATPGFALPAPPFASVRVVVFALSSSSPEAIPAMQSSFVSSCSMYSLGVIEFR
jgi:hypothetical protein